MTGWQAIQNLKRKFTSGNNVQVERATITREEYEAIINHAIWIEPASQLDEHYTENDQP